MFHDHYPNDIANIPSFGPQISRYLDDCVNDDGNKFADMLPDLSSLTDVSSQVSEL